MDNISKMNSRALNVPAIIILAIPLIASNALAGEFPDWAFPGCPSNPSSAAPVSAARMRVPGSTVHFTAGDIANWSVVSDWFPNEHPAMPAVVATSHSPQLPACGYCHLPDGSGRPENAKIAGLSAAYITAELNLFKAGGRHPAQPDWFPSSSMISVSAGLSADEIAAAAEYFSHQAVKSFVRVIESAKVPNHRGACFIHTPSAGRAVLLQTTIVEMPTDLQRFERRDPHTAYVAYVPVGSIARGRQLAMGGDHGRAEPCSMCHGADLRGGTTLPGPPLAGRFPGYLFRQLYGFQTGARAGEAAQAMQPVVARLTQADMIDLAAYAASLQP
jgi:cytochrome c553